MKRNRRNLSEAVDYGWEVPNHMAHEAYDFAIESGYWDEDELNDEIIKCIDGDELAACLAFIFRMHDFEEWQEYLEEKKDGGFDESYRRRLRRRR